MSKNLKATIEAVFKTSKFNEEIAKVENGSTIKKIIIDDNGLHVFFKKEGCKQTEVITYNIREFMDFKIE